MAEEMDESHVSAESADGQSLTQLGLYESFIQSFAVTFQSFLCLL